MSSQTHFNPRYRFRIQGIQVKSTKQIKNKFSARLLVDGVVVHNLLPIRKGQPLAWEELLFCDVNPDSVIGFQLYEEHYSVLKPNLIMKCSVEFSVSEIRCKVPGYKIERTSGAQSLSFTFLNPPTVLHSDSTRAAFTAIADFITSVQEPCPTLAATTLATCRIAWEKLEEGVEYGKDIEELAIGFADILKPIYPVGKGAYLTNLGDTTAGILQLLREAFSVIIEYTSMAERERRGTGFVSSCQVRIQSQLEQLRKLKQDFDRHLDWISEALSNFKPVAHSTHHASRECIPGTRITTISDINGWVEQKTGTDRLLWIYGPSGIGKSSIAASLCRLLDARNMLCTSFFCKWDNPELCEPESVLRSIVYGLASHHTSYMKLAASESGDYPQSRSLSLWMLYERLVALPLIIEVDQATTPEPTCIVVDALDQCGTGQTRRALLKYLFELSKYNSWLKVVVTACPEQDILDFFDGVSEHSLERIDICEYPASADISMFIREQMSSEHGSSLPLNDLQVSALTNGARGLFIWADIACKLIFGGSNPQGRLEAILGRTATTDASLQLDSLYAMVLEDTMVNMNENHAPRRLLGAVVTTGFGIPLPTGSLKQLLGERRPDSLAALLNAFCPVLYEDRSNDPQGVMRVYHRSFIDYIITQSRSKDFYLDFAKQNAALASHCLNTMLGGLKFNICGLQTSYMLNREVPDLESRVKSAISPHLHYSCLWWIDYLAKAEPTDVDLTLLKNFFLGRAMFYWIEVLSLMNKLDIAVSKLPMLIAWTRKHPDLAELAEDAHDAHRFVTTFRDLISESTPHLYLSALAFAPTNSAMAQRGREWFPNAPKLTEGTLRTWSPCLQILPIPSLVLCLALCPGSHTLVTGSNDCVVRLWDVAMSPTVMARLIGHSDYIWSVAFSPNGRYVASASHDKTVRVWDAKTGDKVLEPLMGHSSPVLSVTFFHDSRHIVSGSHDRTVRVWDVETGATARAPLIGHSGPVLSVACSPNNHYIASGSFDKSVRIWDTNTGLSVQFIGHSGWVRSVAFSPDGRRIISGASDKTIRIWDVEPSSRVYAPIIGHSGMVNCVAFSPDSCYIISGSSDTTVRVWDPETGAQLFAPLVGHSDHVLSVACLCDGGRIVSCSSDHTVRIWDGQMRAGRESQALSVVNPGSGPLDLPDGHRTKLDSDDKAMQIWKQEPNTEVSVLLVGHSDLVWSVAFSPDGQRIVSGSDDHTVRIWNAETVAEVPAPLVVSSHSGEVNSVTFSPDSRRIASGSDDRTVRIWDAGTGTQLFAPLVGHSARVWSVAFSPDGRRIASGSDDRTVRMWDAKTGSQLSAPLTGHSSYVSSVAFSPDSRRIVSGSDDKTVRIWDAETGAEVSAPLVCHYGEVNSVAFSPDGRRIASGSDDRTVRIWNADTGVQVSAPLVGHSSYVLSVVFSPDSRFIVSGSDDHTVRIWDAETGSQVFAPLVGHSETVWSVAFSPDGRRIVSGSWDETVRIWDVVHHLVTAGVPFNLSYLLPFIEPTGWVSSPGKPCWLWIPTELRTPTVEAEPTPNSNQTIPPSSCAVIDFSRFMHGRRWAFVAAD